MASDVEVVRRRFTVDEYHRMGEVGILNEDDRVELIRGEIVHMTPIGTRHAACVAILPDSEPQPDIVLLRHRADFYASQLPAPDDVALIIEVADTSIRYDRRVKGQLYTEARIRDYWIVDVPGDAIEIYREPGAVASSSRSGWVAARC